ASGASSVPSPPGDGTRVSRPTSRLMAVAGFKLPDCQRASFMSDDPRGVPRDFSFPRIISNCWGGPTPAAPCLGPAARRCCVPISDTSAGGRGRGSDVDGGGGDAGEGLGGGVRRDVGEPLPGDPLRLERLEGE